MTMMVNQNGIFRLLKNKPQKQSGIILLVVLWIMMILSILTLGLGRRTSIDLSLAKYALGRLRARSLSWAGFIYALEQIQKDTEDQESKKFDTLYQCAVKLENAQDPEDIFKKIPLGEGYFTIAYRGGDEQGRVEYFGFQDEERKININAVNAINPQNYRILSELIMLFGFDADAAAAIASSVVDWRDENPSVTNPPYGAEEEYYNSLGPAYHCKNSPFDSVEELLLIKGMTAEIFSKIRNYITVFPQEASLLTININTASLSVLRALGRSLSGPATSTDVADADSLASEIIIYRQGPDNRDATSDDRPINPNDLTVTEFTSTLNLSEKAIFQSLPSSTKSILSKYINIKLKGFDEAASISSSLEAVVNRDDLSVVFWHRD